MISPPWDTKLYGGGMDGDLDMLKRRNPIPALDNNFRFDDSIDPATGQRRHDYWIVDKDGERKYKGSCTGLIAEYKRKFNAAAAYAGMRRNGRIADKNDEYYGMSLDDCIKQWDDTREAASAAGTLVHAEIEKFYNNCADWLHDPLWRTNPETAPSLKRFMKFHLDVVLKEQFVPLRTEQNLFLEPYELSGQADMLFQRREWLDDPIKCMWVIIADWKRSKKNLGQQVPYKGEKMLGCCSELDAVSFSEYRIQMSLYATILQARTSYIVKELYVGAFHEVNDAYLWLRAEPVYHIVDKMLVERRQKMIARYIRELETSYASAKQPGADLPAIIEAQYLAVRSLRGLLKQQMVFGASNAAILDTAHKSVAVPVDLDGGVALKKHTQGKKNKHQADNDE